MVSYTRYGNTDVFVKGDVRASRCGIIGRSIAGTTVTLDATAPDTLSFAIWDSLARATDAQITSFFKSLSTTDAQTPGLGSILVQGYAAPAAAGVVRFGRTGDHAVAGTNPQIALTGTKASPTDQYRLRINTGQSPAKVAVAKDQLVIRQPQGQIVFVKGVSSIAQVLRGDLVIPLSGADAGKLQFHLDVVDELVFSGLSAVLRADFKQEGIGGDEPVYRAFPLFRPYRPASKAAHIIVLRGDVDPFDLRSTASGLDIMAVDDAGNPGFIETHFVTSYGHPVILKAPSPKAVRNGTAMAPRLVFTEQGVGAGVVGPNVSLLPEGDFDLVLPVAGKNSMRESFGIVCGLSEREYMPIERGQRLAFRVGGAFAGQWPETDKTDVGTKGFEEHTRSSWVGVLASDGTPVTAIVSEDRDYSLFEPERGAAGLHASAAGVALRHAPIRLRPLAAANLSAAQRKAAVETMCLPLFPWKGLRTARSAADVSETAEIFAPADLRRIELRSLAPKRRALVAPEAIAAVSAEQPMSPRYTPMGLEMRVGAGNAMESLVLAEVGSITLELHEIQPELADALLRANLFLVADRLDKLARLKPGVSIAGWGFEADIGTAKKAPNDGPVLIIKGRKGKLADLLNQHEGWALADRLCSLKAPAMAKRIVDLHQKIPPKTGNKDEDAIQDAAFRKITDIFTDPDWTGVLVYNVRLDPSQLPDQITGLLGGVGNEIRVHHVGVDVRRVEPGAASAPTPMFGTVGYRTPSEDEPPEIAAGDFYGFKLGRLVVSFDNGQVGQFLAKGKLATARLFGGEASDYPQPLSRRKAVAPPVIDIKGRYEARIERGERIDVYTFETIAPGEGRIIHLPPGGVLRQIILKRITFSTVSVDRTDSKFLLARTRFLMDGRIVFNKWPSGEVSLFQDGATFSFTELGIDFDFKLKLDPISIDGMPTFHFSPGGISMDFGSLPSMKSLLGKLPFRFRSFELWPEGIDFGKLGYTSLTAGRADTKNEGEFGFVFDLSLGSLGALAEKFKDFKLSLLLGFGYDVKGRKPKFALGFKFAGSGGSGLDIGIGNVLRIRADGYDVGKHPTKDLYFAYALNAKLLIMDHVLPKDAKLNLFLFIDPKPQAPAAAKSRELAPATGPAALPALSSVGWFGIMTNTDPDQDGIVALETLALGQRILLMKGGDPGPGVSVSEYLSRITTQLSKLPESVRKALEANRIETVTGELLERIDYAPERAWMIGLRTKIARILDLDLLVRDPDLYGIHINFKNIVDLDILYRKLSDELGVYSVTLVPPESLRRITTGPADIILPVIGLDFYTDGGFHGHLGYPYNRDFSRSATVEIFPFVGAGGLRAGLFRSGGSQLVPRLRYSDDYVYNPVIEIGIGLRVGLGKSVEKGPFRAALSLTIYAYLEGAQGQLEIKNKNSPYPVPAETFRVLQGAVGIMGEIIGHVDFGIVKAKVEIIAYVESSIRLRTDDYVLLAYEAGVTVRITVVVARFRVFGKTIEIRVSFSFATTVRYSTTAGSRRGDWDEIYIDGARAKSRRLGSPVGWRQLSAPEREAWLDPPIAWDIPDPAILGLKDPLDLPLWFMPDMAAALDPAGGAALEAVFKLYLESAPADDDGPKPYDRFARTLALWAIWAGLKGLRSGGDQDRPLDWIVDRAQLEMLSRRITGADDAAERPGERLPDYKAWSGLFGRCFAVEIVRPPKAGTNDSARTAVFFPMPSDVEILRHFPGQTIGTRLDKRRFVDPGFEQEIEANFAWMRAYWEEEQGRAFAPRQFAAKTLAEILFEEYGGFLLRSFADAAAQAVKPGETLKVSALLDKLDKTDAGRPLRDAGAAASRFFNHGLSLPRPSSGLWAQVKPHLPDPLAALGQADPDAVMPIFRYASLQLGLTRRAGAASPLEQVEAVGLKASAAGGWFKVAADLTRIDVDGDTGNPIDELVAAVGRLEPYAQTIAYQSDLDRERVVTRKPVLYAPAARRDLADAAGTVQMRMLELPAELAGTDLSLAALAVKEHELGSDDITTLKVDPATVVTMRLRRTKDVPPDAAGRSIFEVVGAREAERLVLDALSTEPTLALAPVERPAIRSADLYVPYRKKVDDATPAHWRQLKPGASILQTNLSAEPRSQGLLAARDPVFQASQADDPANFIEIFRRASIVNSAGYWLLVEDPAPGQDDIELLLVIQFNAAKNLTGVNSLAAAPAVVASDTLVVAIAAGEELRVLPRPGHLPILVSLPNPSYGYTVEVDGSPRRVTFEQMVGLASTKAISGRKLQAALEAQNADAQLRERFNLLEVHVADGPDFKATKLGQLLPVGSTEDGANPLVGGAPARLRFRHSLPLKNLLKTASTNPYAAVGKSLRLTYRLRDINGNSLPGAPREASGELGGPITVQYYDGLLAPNELPCLVATFEAGSTGFLRLTLRFDLDAYDHGFAGGTATATGQSRARAIQEAYRMALWQAGGEGFSAWLRTTLVDGPASADPWDPATQGEVKIAALDKLRTFYEAVIAFVSAEALGARRRKKAAPSLALDIKIDRPARAAFVEPSVFLEFRRDAALVHDSIEDVPNALRAGMRVSATYELLTIEKDREPALKSFANELATRLLGGNYVGAKGGPHQTGRPGASLWLVRTSVLPQSAVAMPAAPAFLALPPLSNRPEAFKGFTHPVLLAGDVAGEETVDLVDIDLDVHGQAALERLETLLAPKQTLKLSGTKAGRALLDRVLATKEMLAAALSARAAYILKDAQPNDDDRRAACDALRTRLTARLTAAYEIDTLLAYRLRWPQASTSTETRRPHVFGQLDLRTQAPDSSPPVSGQLIAIPSGIAAESPFIVAYDLAPRESVLSATPSVDVGDLTVSHVQRRPQPDQSELFDLPPQERYRATQWLRLLEPHIVTQLHQTGLDVPVVLRNVPDKPVIRSQSFVPSDPQAATLEQWRKCQATGSWTWNGKPSDNVVAIMRYWPSGEAVAFKARSRDNDLGVALMRFTLATEGCWNRITDALLYPDALLEYLEKRVADLGAVEPFTFTADPPSVEDRIRFARDKAGAWKKDKEQLQDAHKASYEVKDDSGTVTIENVDVMRYSRARFGLEIYRNRAFMLGGKEREAADEFVYSLTGFWGAEPLTPHVRRAAPLSFGSKRTIREHLINILSELFDKTIGRHRIDAHMALVPLALPEALSGSSISGDWPGAAMRPVIGMYSNDTATWSKLADQAEDWLRNAALVRTDGFVALSLRVYREGVDQSAQQAAGEVIETEKQPIFEATRLRIPIANISDIILAQFRGAEVDPA